MDALKLKRFLNRRKEPVYRFSQITQAVFKRAVWDWDQVTNLPKQLREELKKEVPLLSFTVKKILVSKEKRARKALLELNDGKQIETVLLNPKPGLWSCCISTQVGCVMGCLFCATGMMGFQRNLTAEEIVDQVLFWKQYMKKNNFSEKLTHVVYMGMGEPLANQKNVFQSLKILIDPNLFGVGQRHLSVSTSGFAGGIKELGKIFPQVNLAISLHAATDELRNRLMPRNKKYPLKMLINQLKDYLKICKRKVFLEYILFAGINDQKIHAHELAKLIAQIGAPHLLHINLIPFNPTSGPYHSPSKEQTQKFKKYLESLGLKVTIRKSLGQDIQAACGQLATHKG